MLRSATVKTFHADNTASNPAGNAIYQLVVYGLRVFFCLEATKNLLQTEAMPLLERSEFHKAVELPLKSQIYLFCGEPFLARQAVEHLLAAMGASDAITVNIVDGNSEDPAVTLARLQSYSLLPGRQIYRVDDSRLFHSKVVAAELWKKAETAQKGGKEKVAVKNLHALVAAAGITVSSASSLSEIPAEEWKKLCNFDKPSSLQWADALLFQTRDSIKKGGSSLVDTWLNTLNKGLPPANCLILIAETVDKRHRLYKWIKKNALIVDCTVASGSSSAAQTTQRNVLQELLHSTLQQFGKKIDSRCAQLFLERVGFNPAAVVTEAEKLAFYSEDRPVITPADLEEMVGRSREDALYELTDAIGKRELPLAIAIINRLLNQGIHGLAILATLRNYTRKHLVFRAMQLSSSPRWRHGMQAREFQQKYLPLLKENEAWLPHLSGHPYALFVGFSKAAEFDCAALKERLNAILEAEYRLKGSPLPQKVILEELIFSLIKGRPAALASLRQTP